MAATTPHPITKVPEQKLRDLYERDKLTLRLIALRYQCSERSVREAMKRYGIERRGPGSSQTKRKVKENK